LIQLLIAALAGAGIATVAGWTKIERLFGNNRNVETDHNEDDEQPNA